MSITQPPEDSLAGWNEKYTATISCTQMAGRMTDTSRIDWLERGGFLQILCQLGENPDDRSIKVLLFKFGPDLPWRSLLREAIDDAALPIIGLCPEMVMHLTIPGRPVARCRLAPHEGRHEWEAIP